MNKRNQLGTAIVKVDGYVIRTILTSNRVDTGKIGVFAGKKLIGSPVVNNKENIEKLKLSIKPIVLNATSEGSYMITGVQSLRTNKITYKVYNEDSKLIGEFRNKKKAFDFASKIK